VQLRSLAAPDAARFGLQITKPFLATKELQIESTSKLE